MPITKPPARRAGPVLTLLAAVSWACAASAPVAAQDADREAAFIDTLGVQVEACLHSHDAVWCIFDNTASGAALPNALELSAALHRTKAL